jgi:ABC-2 type transport system ATP-binding protein
MDAISFTDISKSFGAVRAVESLDLTIGAGQSVALLGPNGAGKSTSIGMLLGLVRPTTGTVGVFGTDPDDAVKAGRVGAMLQEGALPEGLTVREAVDFVRQLYPAPMSLADVLAMANLTELARRRTDQLSGGQKQRVSFALAIAGAPDLLVLDEPTAAMDVESRRAFWADMRGYAAGGRTILFATHYLEEADENADRVIVIAGGKVVADGTPQQIKASVGVGTVRFALGDQPTAGLDALPGVTAVEAHNGSVSLTTTDPDATVQALYRTDLRIQGLEVHGADLEDAFLAITRS